MEHTAEGKSMVDNLIALYDDLKILRLTSSYDQELNNKQAYIYFELLFEILTDHSNLSFSTLFSRITYHSSKKLWPKNYVRSAHILRKIHDDYVLDTSVQSKFFYFIIDYCLAQIDFELGRGHPDLEIPADLTAIIDLGAYKKVSYRPLVKGVAIEINSEKKEIRFLENNGAAEEILVKYNVIGQNDIHTKALESIKDVGKFPVPLHCCDVDIDEKGYLIPAYFVIYPDYLLDVTTIAAVHSENYVSPWLYILSRFKAKTTSPAIMIGNVCNFFLEQLIQNSELEFKDLRGQIFLMEPITWATYDDATVKNTLEKLCVHFINLKQVIQKEFVKHGIKNGKIYLEPSFYCSDYGIQGRLDMFHINDERNKAEIIELKSGKIFKPNSYGINHSHYSQTILYDLIIKSVYRNQINSSNFLLYTQGDKDNLRLAPTSTKIISELMKARNEIILIEHAIVQQDGLISKVFKYLKTTNFIDLKGFIKQELAEFEGVYGSLSSLEKKYFDYFVSFISKEQLLAKTGEHGISKSNGLSALWLESEDEKVDRFSILNKLSILSNQSHLELPIITFKRTEFTNALANFRVGDIAILYPHSPNRNNILHHEIFKCNILSIDAEKIDVRLRHVQLNQHIFKITKYWNLEEDVLDSSFRHMYRGVYDFALAAKPTRDLLLGIKKPSFNNQEVHYDLDASLTPHQKAIIRKMVCTKHYMLIWGPPGTGKTSKIIKYAAKALYDTSSDPMIYLAYTNKAVDEICSALVDIGLENDFIRIGSKFSVATAYHPNLLDNKIAHCRSRNEVTTMIKSCKIFVSTLSSMLGKPELFEMISFDLAIIDEASQILEPALIGLLTKFRRFVLIGDHKQLPAVVTQKPASSKIDNDILNVHGFYDTRMSFFERLYLQIQRNGWYHVLEILDQQGRMHRDIMQFVNQNFYEGSLKTLPKIDRLTKNKYLSSQDFDILASNRIVFVPCSVEIKSNYKVNMEEAEKCIKLLIQISKIYSENNMTISQDTIGVITPYRAQIALIKSMLPDNISDLVTVDTVERFQGGARDIIIFSTCTNRQSQLESLVSLSHEGVDRKLNVAITRAKEQFIMLGNETILLKNQVYANLIQYSKQYIMEI